MSSYFFILTLLGFGGGLQFTILQSGFGAGVRYNTPPGPSANSTPTGEVPHPKKQTNEIEMIINFFMDKSPYRKYSHVKLFFLVTNSQNLTTGKTF